MRQVRLCVGIKYDTGLLESDRPTELDNTHIDYVVLGIVRVSAAHVYPASVADGLDHSDVVSAIEILQEKTRKNRPVIIK